MKVLLAFVLLLSVAVPLSAQVKLQTVGPIIGYTTLQVQARQQLVGRFPVYLGETDMNHLRLGAFAGVALPVSSLFFRAELSYVNHSLWGSARNPDHDPAQDGLQWVTTSAIYKYNRLEFAPLLSWQQRHWQVHAGAFAWYRFRDATQRQPDPHPNRYIFAELERGIATWVGGYKLGGGLTLGRLHAEVNYSYNLTSLTRPTLLHQGQSVPFFRLQASSLTYDLRVDLYRRHPLGDSK